MPWRVFAQSLALTNSGDQLANELFVQRQNASCSLNIAPKWGDSVFKLFCCHLETHFEVKQEKSAHVDPGTPCDGLQVCFIFVRYLVLLFLVWKIYWNMVASTLLHFYLSSKGMDSTFLRTSFLSTCSLVKYLQVLFPFELSTDIFH